MSFTEAELLAALRDRYTFAGNGGAGRYAVLTHVRTGAAWDQQEIDAVVFCLWPSDSHSLMAFEAKCSRSDWLREIRPDTSKSARARRLCDSFSIVAPLGIVMPGELPAGWGLLSASHTTSGAVQMRWMVMPTPRPEKPEIARTFLVALLRAADAVPGMRSGRKRATVDKIEATAEPEA